MVWYKVGAADETGGQSGIAHFLEHLMFKGTQKHPGDQFRQRVAAIGGDENAFTSSDYTAYFQRVAKENLGEMMRFESDRMTNLVLDDAGVATERDVVLNERRDRVRRTRTRCSTRRWSASLSQPPLRPADYRLEPRDHRTRPHHRARLLQALLHAQQRRLVVSGDVSRGGRRLRRDLRQDPGRPEAVRAPRPPSRPPSARAPITCAENVNEPQSSAPSRPSVVTAEPARRSAERAAEIPARRHQPLSTTAGARRWPATYAGPLPDERLGRHALSSLRPAKPAPTCGPGGAMER
jgi:zinc protease